ncbi:MAG: helix-turn-helix domain-containing protein [Planctomycetota bacterium]|jgi:AraC family L-rhamnose operon transcriptional activator RhaR/AraC family L-rhamnose operon regulatory protein RhaS
MHQHNPIGSVIELGDHGERVYRCFGTYRDDFPDASFRFNIHNVLLTGDFPNHYHQYSELVIVLDGSATHQTDYEDYPIGPGDVFVINGAQSHGYADVEGLTLCNIMYDPARFLKGQRDLNQMEGYQALFDLEPRTSQEPGFKQRLRLAGAQRAHIESLLRLLKAEFDDKQPGRQTAIHSSFLMLITSLCRAYASFKKDGPSLTSRMARVAAHIHKHYNEPLRIEQLARIACLSTSQFQRTFKRVYKVTPNRYIQSVRLDESCELLKDPDRDIASIARDTGFGTASFFSAQFKRRLGLTPGAYRKQREVGFNVNVRVPSLEESAGRAV